MDVELFSSNLATVSCFGKETANDWILLTLLTHFVPHVTWASAVIKLLSSGDKKCAAFTKKHVLCGLRVCFYLKGKSSDLLPFVVV